MAYEFDEVKISQEIFYYLLEHHELKEEEVPQLYKAYTESESVQNLVKSQGEIADCSVERYGDVIYLIPDTKNRFLGYSKAQLKKELCRSNATDRDYYLVQFSILILKEGAEKLDESEQELYGVAYDQMLQAYESLRSDERGSRQKTTKEGFLHHILRFLQTQGLVEYIEQDEMVKTTRKLDHFMDWNLLNKANYQRVLDIIGARDE